jgi:hypothetical protein
MGIAGALVTIAATAAAVPAYASAPSAAHASSRTVATSGGTFTVRVVTAPANSGRVVPNSDGGCVGNLDWDNIQTCVFITGSGLHVDTMKGISYVYNYPVLEHVALKGPSVNYATLDFWIEEGQYLEVLWSPNSNVTAGDYCATSWEANGSGGYTNRGTECQPVHP